MGCFFYTKNLGKEKEITNFKEKNRRFTKNGNVEKTRKTGNSCISCNGNDGFIGYRLSAGKNC